MSRKHANISIFVPHIGCPNKCSFCNQRHITGTSTAPTSEDVEEAVNVAISSENYNPKTTEIAFFGGSFTAINRNYMLNLLSVAYRFVENGAVKGIRISTRPDAIDEEVLSILKAHGVTAIELGAQSLDDNVLLLNKRGHKAEDVVKASQLIRKFGFELGLQIMTGLYADTEELSIKTAEKVIEIAPDTVRIYPTILLKDTDLAILYLDKLYAPQTLEEAVNLSAKLYTMFTDAGIKVIRLGLHSIDNDAYIAGPWHPAFSELCISKIMLNKVLNMLCDKGDYTIFVSRGFISKMTGQKRSNIEILRNLGFNCRVKEDNTLDDLDIKLVKEV